MPTYSYTQALLAASSKPNTSTPSFRLDELSTPVSRKPSGRALNFVADTREEVHRKDIILDPKHETERTNIVKKTSSERILGRGRQNSLRHVKNSTEVLRQRSSRRAAKDIVPEGSSGGREGRQFTVANVGNNGMIYLR